MNPLRNKIKSRRGASMLLGLLFLLLCLTVGAVVLTAASVSAGRTARNRRVQQNYLAVQSAANLLMDDMADMAFRGEYVYEYYTHYHSATDGEGNTYYYTTHEEKRRDTQALTGTELQAALEGYVQKLFLSTPALEPYQERRPAAPGQERVVFTVSDRAEAAGEGRNLPAVTVELTLGLPAAAGGGGYAEEGYTVTAQFSLAEPGPEGDHRMTVRLAPVVTTAEEKSSVDGNPRIDTTTITSTVTWEPPLVTKGAATWET